MKNIILLILAVIISNTFILAQSNADSIVNKGKPIIQVFGNFDYNATKNIQKEYEFWFGRAHFGYEYQYSKELSGKIIIDAGRPTKIENITVKDSLGNDLLVTYKSNDGAYYTMNLKFASIQWKPSDYFKIQIGAVLLNHYMTQERFWGYRYIAETFQDRYYKMPSSDLGFITYIKANDNIGFDFALVNGEGFRSEQDSYGDIKIALGYDYIPIKELQTRLYYEYHHPKDPLKSAEMQLFSIFAGYKLVEKFRIGAEYNYRKNHLNKPNQDLFGYSIYGSYNISKNVEYFLRYDNLSSNKKDNQTYEWNYNSDGKAIITGFHFNPVKNINLSLNYQGFISNNSNINYKHHFLMSFEFKL